ncbi:MAG TPA: CBS domain-containing protein [Chthonomonadales bacterium]|nr:CBS domain-containing protein [Chthonomonadales bacterium]
MKAREAMTPTPTFCTPETTIYAASRLMVDIGCGALPVVQAPENAKLLGIITDRDITCRAVAHGYSPSRTTVAETMSAPVVTAHPEDTLSECGRLMALHRVRRLPLVDNGACCGILSLTDLFEWAPPDAAARVARAVSSQQTATRFPPRTEKSDADAPAPVGAGAAS